MLTAGTRVGRYEVIELLGAGAMGEVFRARDPQLGRFVALKTLPERVPRDAERLARLEREARVLASLNHPNIATLHELAAVGDTHVLVLELVEGETLADRLARGPMPVAEAVPIAAQIATALEVAHEQGIVHRDLKPANVKLRADGTVKLLDFGLAKVLETHADGSGEAEATVTALETNAGGRSVIGTPAYMSPEQARGLPVDKRTDVWAFGCVLHEMLAGRRAFVGEHSTDVLVSVVDREPAFEGLPAECPAALRRLLRRCLTKDSRHRLRDIGDARLELADAAAGVDLVETSYGTFLFYSTNGPGGDSDIFVSHMRDDGSFGPGEVVESLSSPYDDFMPNVREREQGGFEIVFSSSRPSPECAAIDSCGSQDVFASFAGHLPGQWLDPVNLGGNVNTDGAELRATLSRDRKRLVFGRSGDIYMSERE